MKDTIVGTQDGRDFKVLPATDTKLCQAILELLRLEDEMEGWRATPSSLVQSFEGEHPDAEVLRAIDSLIAHGKAHLGDDGRLFITC